jgi:hypothetical protein
MPLECPPSYRLIHIYLLINTANYTTTLKASLDVQYISAMGSGVETEFWSYAGTAPDNKKNEPFLDWILQVSNTSDMEVPCWGFADVSSFCVRCDWRSTRIATAALNRTSDHPSRWLPLLFCCYHFLSLHLDRHSLLPNHTDTGPNAFLSSYCDLVPAFHCIANSPLPFTLLVPCTPSLHLARPLHPNHRSRSSSLPHTANQNHPSQWLT